MEGNREIINTKFLSPNPSMRNTHKKTRLVLMNYYADDLDLYLKIKSKKYIPHFFIDKSGNIFQTKQIEEVSLLMSQYNEHNIYCALQNGGPVFKNKRGEVYDSYNNLYTDLVSYIQWKGFDMFSLYKAEQYMGVHNIAKKLSEELQINFFNMVYHSADKVKPDFVGTCGRSNLDELYYDLCPTFHYEQLFITKDDE